MSLELTYFTRYFAAFGFSVVVNKIDNEFPVWFWRDDCNRP